MNIPNRKYRSLKEYLSKPMHPSYKAAIEKKLKLLLSMPSEPDSQPFDAYRFYGMQIVRRDLIAEVNKIIMEAVGTTYIYLQNWAQELWDLHEICRAQAKTSREMIDSLIARGHVDGFFKADEPANK